MNYLLYVERSAENLQFFLWHRDYERRFAAAKTADLSLAPEWTQAMEDEAIMRIKKEQAEKVRRAPKGTPTIFKGTDFEKSIDSREELITPVTPTDRTRSLASQAFASAGVNNPCKSPSLHVGTQRRHVGTQRRKTHATNNPTPPAKSLSNPSARNSTG